MKTNLRRLGSMLLAVGMMSALSLTALAAEAIPAAKLTAATMVSNSADSIPMTKIIGTTDKNATVNIDIAGGATSLPVQFEAISGYTIKTLANGILELVNMKTGEKVSAMKAIPITQIATSSIEK